MGGQTDWLQIMSNRESTGLMQGMLKLTSIKTALDSFLRLQLFTLTGEILESVSYWIYLSALVSMPSCHLTQDVWDTIMTNIVNISFVFCICFRSDSIHTINYDGSDHRIILHGHEFLSHPFAISVFGIHVYWTDWRTNSLVQVS